jgi:hypothetical protein
MVTGTAASDLSMKAGLGYDFFSQQYFLDSAILSGPESLYTTWSLENNYLDDQKGMFSLTYRPFEDRRLEMTTRYEQTGDFMRLKCLSDYSGYWGSKKMSLNTQVDWRHRYHGTASFGDSYIYGYGRGRLSVPMTGSISGTGQLQGEFVRFDSTSSLSYNYYRLGGKLGAEKLFRNFSYGNISLTAMSRRVPDSAQLNYLSLGIEGSLFAFYRGGEADVFFRGEHKDYNQPDDQDDHYRFEITGRNKIRLSDDYFTEQDLDLETVKYRPEDIVNLNYTQAELALLTGLETAGLSLAIGPDFALLKEERQEFATVEDYLETGAKLELDLISAGTYFLSFESVLGVRNLKESNDLQTDFSFARINVLGDVRILQKIDLNVLFSTELEHHDIKTNDSRIYLLSSTLSYQF